jgi:serine protease Do
MNGQRSARRWIATGGAALAVALAGAGATSLAAATEEVPGSEPAAPAPLPVPVLPSFAPLVDRLAPTVVSIHVIQRVRLGEGGLNIPFPFFFDPFGDMAPFGGPGGPPPEFENRGSGSGVIVDPDGFILTNAHVVDDASEITVQLGEGEMLPGEVVGSDPPTDLALLRVRADRPLAAASLGDSDDLHVGDWVMAIGNPFGLEHTVTTGIVSAKERRTGGPDAPYGSFIQTDASINPGNSGGPLFDLSGRVVGINTAINAAGQGIGFAIPSNMARAVVEQLRAHGRVLRSWIGVTIQSVTPELAQSFGLTGGPRGALVSDVQPDSPASRAGIRRGDIIVRFGDEEIGDAAELPWLASTGGAGTQVRLQVFRNGVKRDLAVTLAEMPREQDAQAGAGGNTGDEEQPGGLGMQVAPVPDQLRRGLEIAEGGAMVSRVDPFGAAADHGIRPGDVILEIDGHAVAGPDDFAERLRGRVKADVVRLLVRSREGVRYVGIPLR